MQKISFCEINNNLYLLNLVIRITVILQQKFKILKQILKNFSL